MKQRCYIGLDLGTSGCRAIAIDQSELELARGSVAIPTPETPGPNRVEQDALLWWDSVQQVLRRLVADLPDHRPAAICVDGTSSTLLLSSLDGHPLGPALMYNDQSALHAARRVAEAAPADSAARGPSASLAKLLALSDRAGSKTACVALHQSDWILGKLWGQFEATDWNNALKMGFDPIRLDWPTWVRGLVPANVVLPRVVAPGSVLGRLSACAADSTGLPPETLVLAGTTDSTAAAIAAGVVEPGDALTSLGSTLVVKILSEQPITASRHGVYSQRFGTAWLVGGASNSGGAVLRQFFSDEELRDLSGLIDPETDTGLHYYPLPAAGERFPRQAPELRAKLEPRPEEPHRFLQGLLEGMAAIEAEGYTRLAELGAPRPRRIRTVGGGAANTAWTRIRERYLEIRTEPAEHNEAAYGSARLALRGALAQAAHPT